MGRRCRRRRTLRRLLLLFLLLFSFFCPQPRCAESPPKILLRIYVCTALETLPERETLPRFINCVKLTGRRRTQSTSIAIGRVYNTIPRYIILYHKVVYILYMHDIKKARKCVKSPWPGILYITFGGRTVYRAHGRFILIIHIIRV